MTDRTPGPLPNTTPALINGQADTAEAMALLKLIKDLTLRAWREHLTQPDQIFLFDMSDKFSKFGTGLYVSQRQLDRLRQLRVNLVKAGVL